MKKTASRSLFRLVRGVPPRKKTPPLVIVALADDALEAGWTRVRAYWNGAYWLIRGIAPS